MPFTGHNVAVIIGIILIALIAWVVSATTQKAYGHDWYPTECCKGSEYGGDCKPVPEKDLRQEGACWVYLPTGNKFCGKAIRYSPDNQWHVCIGPAYEGSQQGFSYCVFIKGRGF